MRPFYYNLLIRALIIFFSIFLLAAKGPKENRKEIKAVMHYFHDKLEDLEEVIHTQEQFGKKENRKLILSTLSRLEAKIRKFQPEKISKAPGFSVTYELLGNHIQISKEMFLEGELEYARRNIGATTQFCVACHGRLPIKSAFLKMDWLDGKFSTPKEALGEAEFLFLERQFGRALKIYNQLIRQFKSGKGSEFDLSQALQQKLIIHTRVYRSPHQAIQSFKEDLKNKNLPLVAEADIKVWIESLKKLKLTSKNWVAMGNKKFLNQARKQLSPVFKMRSVSGSSPHLVNLLYISGLLYEKVFESPNDKNSGEFLFLLAKSERQLNSIYNYSLADQYLKSCAKLYSDQSIGKKCLKELQNQMTLKFPNGLPKTMEMQIRKLNLDVSK